MLFIIIKGLSYLSNEVISPTWIGLYKPRRKNRYSVFPTRSDTNQPVQSQNKARSLKFWSKNKKGIVLSVKRVQWRLSAAQLLHSGSAHLRIGLDLIALLNWIRLILGPYSCVQIEKTEGKVKAFHSLESICNTPKHY